MWWKVENHHESYLSTLLITVNFPLWVVHRHLLNFTPWKYSTICSKMYKSCYVHWCFTSWNLDLSSDLCISQKYTLLQCPNSMLGVCVFIFIFWPQGDTFGTLKKTRAICTCRSTGKCNASKGPCLAKHDYHYDILIEMSEISLKLQN